MQSPAPFSPQPAAAAQELHKQASTWARHLPGKLRLLRQPLSRRRRRRVLLLGHAGGQPGFAADAEAKLKWGKILTLVGSVMGMLSTTLALILRSKGP